MRKLLFLVGLGCVVINACSSDTSTDRGDGDSDDGGTNATSSTSGPGATSTGAGPSSAASSGAGGGSTSVASSAASTTASSAASSGAGGAPGPCDVACTKLQGCLGVDYCTQSGITCQNGDFDCEAQCVLSTSCQDIIGMSSGFSSCVQTCSGGGAGGGGVGGGGGGMSCQDCAFNSCGAPLNTCASDGLCANWALCVQSCIQQNDTDVCYDQCDAANAGASALYSPVYACMCTNCAASCANSNPCNP